MKYFKILFFLFISHAYGQSDSTLSTSCKQDGFSCGECETALQNDLNALMKKMTNGAFTAKDHWGSGKEDTKNSSHVAMAPGVTLEKTLEEIISLFKKHNPVGDNKLNFVVIGESESAQGTSVKNGRINPRVMLKSPNSELMVTFNTDPESKGYKTLEIMRWNGRQGRYEFQELNFGEKGAQPHIDASGTKCMECHKESPRPNWDTYRAWAGVVPSRDDMLEMHSNENEFIHSKGLQPDARAYLGFLDQVAEEKDSGKKTRLAMLDIPFDDKNQLRDYVEQIGGKKLTAREQVDIIKKNLSEKGYYRVKHFPDKDEAREGDAKMAFNFDNKTAEWAGPSQFAFDQMLAQNMCKVTTDLKKHPDYNKFKYGLALLMACNSTGRMEDVYPKEFRNKILNHFKDTNYASLMDIDPKKKPKQKLSDISKIKELVREDTAQSHKNADGFKFNRHGRFLASYLKDVEKLSPTQAKKDAEYYSKEVVSPTLSGFHAIDDQGGVKGVPENSTEVMSDVRLLLEPFGVKVGHWSLVHGKSSAYNSFSFSDQFVLFQEQEEWTKILREAGSCGELEAKARTALSSADSLIASETPESDNVSDLQVMCGQTDKGVISGPVFESVAAIVTEQLKPDMKESMKKCLTCHDAGGIEFPGLFQFVTSDNEETFRSFLNTRHEKTGRSMIEVVQIKLGMFERPVDNVDYGLDMPPMDWFDNKDYGEKYGIPLSKVQAERRKQLGLFLTMMAAKDRKEVMKEMCEKINSNNYIKDFNQSTKKKKSSKASKQ